MGGSPALNVPAKTGITLSKIKTEAVLVRTYLKYQSNDQFCYVCENGYHKASDCKVSVAKVIKDRPQKENCVEHVIILNL